MIWKTYNISSIASKIAYSMYIIHCWSLQSWISRCSTDWYQIGDRTTWLRSHNSNPITYNKIRKNPSFQIVLLCPLIVMDVWLLVYATTVKIGESNAALDIELTVNVDGLVTTKLTQYNGPFAGPPKKAVKLVGSNVAETNLTKKKLDQFKSQKIQVYQNSCL